MVVGCKQDLEREGLPYPEIEAMVSGKLHFREKYNTVHYVIPIKITQSVDIPCPLKS